MSLLLNQVICGDSAIELKNLPNNTIDLIVTSPPYDFIRSYESNFDFETIAKELFRIIKNGGVLVWIVGDSTSNYSESGTSFKQALFFKEIGFKIFDTMIYFKKSMQPPHNHIYHQTFEYMFVFSKGKPKTFNPIMDHKNKYKNYTGTRREVDNSLTKKRGSMALFSKRGNVWLYDTGYMKSTKDIIAYKHPAIFPEKLAKDHIISWSNEGDLILDPFAGSGTTLKMAKLTNRNYLGIEISKEYCEIANKRLEKYNNQTLTAFTKEGNSN